ncbi:MAG: glycosyltransferase [Chloroflexi bacterium]|nr:glycosyltransferase [Chloroflexota bacterium]
MSVALVTRNRPDSLGRTLQSLREQGEQPWEVVVSDDSDDAQAARTAAVAATYGCRYIRGPRRGLYANRNHAALSCTGTHIRTMDDDHEFPAGHMAACSQAIADAPGTVWVIGEYLPQDCQLGTPRYPWQLSPRGFSVPPLDSDSCHGIADGATIYPRSIFDAGIRYFDGFLFGSAYLEFGCLLHWLGYRTRRLRTTHIIHHYDEQTRSFSAAGIVEPSRYFAMLCLALLYEPNLHNTPLCVAQFALELARKGPQTLRWLRLGFQAYLTRRREALAYETSAPCNPNCEVATVDSVRPCEAANAVLRVQARTPNGIGAGGAA